jgi:hypothetical protein
MGRRDAAEVASASIYEDAKPTSMSVWAKQDDMSTLNERSFNLDNLDSTFSRNPKAKTSLASYQVQEFEELPLAR